MKNNTLAVVESNPIAKSNIIDNLEGLMTKVTSQEITPDTVNAACNCAEKITDIFKVYLEFEKHKTKVKILEMKD